MAAVLTLAAATHASPAHAQYLTGWNGSALGGILLVVLGIGGVATSLALIDPVSKSESCSSGPAHDKSTCTGYIAGTTAAGVVGLGLVTLGIVVLAMPDRSRSRSQLAPAPGFAALTPLPTLELAPTLHGFALRGTF